MDGRICPLNAFCSSAVTLYFGNNPRLISAAFDDLPREVRWCQHGPSVLYGFRRIKQLARLATRAEYASVQHAAKEVEIVAAF